MTETVIINGIVGAILLAFVLAGAHRGLFRSVAGLAILIVSLVGGSMLANTLTPVLADYLEPMIQRHVEEKLETALSGGEVDPEKPSIGTPATGENPDPAGLDISQLLQLLGIDADPANAIRTAAEEKVQQTGTTIATAVVESMAESILHVLIFALSAAALTIVLNLAMRALDLVLKLPGLHLMNTLGGAAVGLVEGALALFLAIWVLRRFGVSFDTETLQSAALLRFFTANTPFSVLKFL